MSPTANARSRTMQGATPNTISTTFESSPSPNTMNRIGRIAIGGIIERTAMSGPKRRADERQEADGEPER